MGTQQNDSTNHKKGATTVKARVSGDDNSKDESKVPIVTSRKNSTKSKKRSLSSSSTLSVFHKLEEQPLSSLSPFVSKEEKEKKKRIKIINTTTTTTNNPMSNGSKEDQTDDTNNKLNTNKSNGSESGRKEGTDSSVNDTTNTDGGNDNTDDDFLCSLLDFEQLTEALDMDDHPTTLCHKNDTLPDNDDDTDDTTATTDDPLDALLMSNS